MLVRIVAPNFVAGFVVNNGRVTETAPILRRMLLGHTADEARNIIRRLGWKASVIREKKGGSETGDGTEVIRK